MSQPETASSRIGRRAMTGRRVIRIVKLLKATIPAFALRATARQALLDSVLDSRRLGLLFASAHHVGSQIPPAGIPGRAARAAPGAGACAEEGVHAARAAARSAEDLQHAGLPRGGAVRALRERVDGGHRVEP